MEQHFDFRTLHHALCGQLDGHQEILLSHCDQSMASMETLKKYGAIESKEWKIGKAPNLNESLLFDIWELYALSRVNDFLLLPFQSGSEFKSGWPGPSVEPHDYFKFFLSLGMHEFHEKNFHPFYHEIIEVNQSDDRNEPIALAEIVWPGFMLGEMMFSRAGVKVTGGAAHIKKEIAEQSTLYWTFRRKNRPVSDLSHGWGSNSQWRTNFRRDYKSEKSFFYNVDEELDVRFPDPLTTHTANPAREDLTPDERIELLRNRCFIITEKPHNDLWPFEDFYIEQTRS